MAYEAEETGEGTEEDEIREIERARLHALVEADMETANRLHADDFQLVSPSGRTYSKEEYLSGVASGDIHYLLWEADPEIAVRLHGQAADIRYRSQLQIVFRGRESIGFYWHTDTYEKNNGQWQVVWSQATQTE